MSQIGQFSFEEAIETLTGNTGDIVHPQVGNINIVGVGDITVNGNNTTGTLTITQTGSLANTYTTDSGNAAPVAGTIRILGGNNLNTAGTGNTVTVHLDDSIVQPVTNASGTQGLYSLGANRFMHGIGTNNTFLGSTAGNLGLTVATSVGNVGLGSAVLTGITSAAYNVGVGASALTLVTTGVANTAVGALAGSLMNGSGNTLLGKEAGISYVGTESYNIIIGNSGTAGESNKIRIGTYGTGSGQQDTAYIAGNVHGSNGLTADSGNIVCTAGDISASTGNIYATAGYIETVDNDIYIGDKTVNITGPDLQFKKSRNGAVISAGDVLGNIKFSGYDGTSYDVAAQITSLSSGSIGTGRIAADLQFWTSPDVAGIALRRMDVKPTGEVYIYTPDSGVGLTIQGRGETITAGNLDLTDGNIYVDNPAVSSDGSDINFRKSRASATVVNADNLGNLVYWGHDGANYIIASAIISNVTATPATNKIPSNLEFWTHPDSTVASTKRVTIASTGEVTIATPDSGTALTVSGTTSSTTFSTSAAAANLSLTGATFTAGGSDAAVPITLTPKGTGGFFAGGIYGKTVGATNGLVYIDNANQLGSTNSPSVTGSVTAGTDLISTAGHASIPATTYQFTKGVVKIGGYKAVHMLGGNTNIWVGDEVANSRGTGFYQTCTYNTGVGYSALGEIWVSSSYNTAIGAKALATAGDDSGSESITGNTCVGYNSMGGTNGSNSYNTCIGYNTLAGNVPSNYAVAIGYNAGSGVGESGSQGNSCIYILNAGGNENNKIRIGTQGTGNGQQDACYIAGIYGVTPGGTKNVALVDSNGQLGSTTNIAPYVSGVMVWSEVTGTTQAAAVDNGYVTNNAALVTVTLPATAAIGEMVSIVGKGAGLWKVAQNSGQTIHFGSIDTTTGTGGYLAATVRYDCVDLICITANTDWCVKSSSGTITIV